MQRTCVRCSVRHHTGQCTSDRLVADHPSPSAEHWCQDGFFAALFDRKQHCFFGVTDSVARHPSQPTTASHCSLVPPPFCCLREVAHYDAPTQRAAMVCSPAMLIINAQPPECTVHPNPIGCSCTGSGSACETLHMRARVPWRQRLAPSQRSQPTVDYLDVIFCTVVRLAANFARSSSTRLLWKLPTADLLARIRSAMFGTCDRTTRARAMALTLSFNVCSACTRERTILSRRCSSSRWFRTRSIASRSCSSMYDISVISPQPDVALLSTIFVRSMGTLSSARICRITSARLAASCSCIFAACSSNALLSCATPLRTNALASTVSSTACCVRSCMSATSITFWRLVSCSSRFSNARFCRSSSVSLLSSRADRRLVVPCLALASTASSREMSPCRCLISMASCRSFSSSACISSARSCSATVSNAPAATLARRASSRSRSARSRRSSRKMAPALSLTSTGLLSAAGTGRALMVTLRCSASRCRIVSCSCSVRSDKALVASDAVGSAFDVCRVCSALARFIRRFRSRAFCSIGVAYVVAGIGLVTGGATARAGSAGFFTRGLDKLNGWGVVGAFAGGATVLLVSLL
eukprot:m.980285 g.980285  ORF g.980285 m.980285 type:complete len:584 (+) comp23964_c1_seq12:2348-4099(+)